MAWEAPFCQKSQNRCTLLNNFMRKGKDPELDPNPYLWLMDQIRIQEAQKNMRILRIRIKIPNSG